jgi:hypothetical protein
LQSLQPSAGVGARFALGLVAVEGGGSREIFSCGCGSRDILSCGCGSRDILSCGCGSRDILSCGCCLRHHWGMLLHVSCSRPLEMKLQGLCDRVTRSCSCQRCCDWGGSTCSFASPSHRLALSLGFALHPPFPATFVSISLGHTLQQQYGTPHRMRTAISRASNAASTPLRSA